MFNKKLFLLILIGLFICVSAEEKIRDDEVPDVLRKEIEKIADTIKVVENEIDRINNTQLDDPEAAVNEGAQKAKTIEILKKTIYYLNTTSTLITWGSRMSMKKLIGDDLMKFFQPCKHDVKILRTALVDGVWACGGKYLYGDETILQKPINTTRQLVKNLIKIPEKFEKCQKGTISQYVKFYCPVKYAIKIGYWVTQATTSLVSDISKLTSTAMEKKIENWGDLVETGMTISATVRQCLKPKVKEIRQQCQEEKNKEDLESMSMTEEDLLAELEKEEPVIQALAQTFIVLQEVAHDNDVEKARQTLEEILK